MRARALSVAAACLLGAAIANCGSSQPPGGTGAGGTDAGVSSDAGVGSGGGGSTDAGSGSGGGSSVDAGSGSGGGGGSGGSSDAGGGSGGGGGGRGDSASATVTPSPLPPERSPTCSLAVSDFAGNVALESHDFPNALNWFTFSSSGSPLGRIDSTLTLIPGDSGFEGVAAWYGAGSPMDRWHAWTWTPDGS